MKNTKSTGKKPAAAKKTAAAKKPAPVKKVPAVTPNWLYLLPVELSVKALAEALDDSTYPGIEVWPEAGVLEVPVAEKASVDFEEMECDLGDDYGNAFLADNHVKSLFMVTIVPDAWEASKELMKKLSAAKGGFFCGDTEDFTPVVKGQA